MLGELFTRPRHWSDKPQRDLIRFWISKDADVYLLLTSNGERIPLSSALGVAVETALPGIPNGAGKVKLSYSRKAC
jgi:hypothetical protein